MTQGDAVSATRLYTIPETAARLGIERNTVYRLINAGALRGVNIAASGSKSRLRIREDDLAEFIEARTASTEKPSTDDAFAATS